MSLRHLVKKLVFSCRSCRGMTLVELLVALSIGSAVMVGCTQILTQLFVLVPKAQDSMLAMRQVQFAGHLIDRDAIKAQSIAPTPNLFTLSAATPLIISHVNWDSDNATITYFVDSDHALQRQEVVKNKSGVILSSNQIPVVNSITSITAQYSQPDVYNSRKILTLTISAQVGNSPETRIYKISPRSF
jgi:prepilin-type N-terminal cleavage/methylation domain-containing protein